MSWFFAPHRLHQWVAERLPLSESLRFLRDKSVPVHRHGLWYYCGNIILTGFLIQIVTGIVLLFHYQPTVATAHESIRSIVLEVHYGWLMRSIHKWSAHFMIAAVWVHLFSTFFLKAYRRPRELTWLSGVVLFILVMGLGFSGYLLPWSEQAFFATKVGTGIAGQVPVVGQGLKLFLRGGEEVGNATLTRFFALHVALLPLAVAVVAGLHLLLVQLHGLSVPLSLEKKRPSLEHMPFLPEFILRDLAVSCWIIAIVVTLAVFLPCEVEKKYDPLLSTPDAVLPEWYFLFMFKTLQLIPAKMGALSGARIGILFFGAIFLFISLVPFLDRRAAEDRASPWFTFAGMVMLGFVMLMTWLALVMPE